MNIKDQLRRNTEEIIAAINAVRQDTLELLQMLD